MVTIEEAKKTLEKYLVCLNRLKTCEDDCCFCYCYVSRQQRLEAIKAVCEHLRAKKPNEYKRTKHIVCCPSCGIFLHVKYRMNHCLKCGQALDWGEIE